MLHGSDPVSDPRILFIKCLGLLQYCRPRDCEFMLRGDMSAMGQVFSEKLAEDGLNAGGTEITVNKVVSPRDKFTTHVVVR